MGILIVTGTGTDVGKTVTTAALAACARGSVAVVKPVQTGVEVGAPGDLTEVTRLSGCTDVHEFARYREALAPHHAAQVAQLPEFDPVAALGRIASLAATRDLVLVEGAGGLLVPYRNDGWTVADLARELDAPLLVVVAAGLGTINHTALTVREIERQQLEVAGIVIGSWPARPGLAEHYALTDLAALSGHGVLAGALPAGMGTSAEFGLLAHRALAPCFGGTFDWSAFAGLATTSGAAR